MAPYIHFTPEQKEQARMTDLVDLLHRNGETLKRSGTEHQWGEGSNKVTIRGNTWFHQYERVGGDAIDFVRRFYNKSFPEAVEYLLCQSSGVITTAPQRPRQPKEEKVFELPPRNDNMRRVYAYLLQHRKLDRDTKGDVVRNYGKIAQQYGYSVSVIDLRNPTRSNGNNLLHLVNKYMDLHLAHPDQLIYKEASQIIVSMYFTMGCRRSM